MNFLDHAQHAIGSYWILWYSVSHADSLCPDSETGRITKSSSGTCSNSSSTASSTVVANSKRYYALGKAHPSTCQFKTSKQCTECLYKWVDSLNHPSSSFTIFKRGHIRQLAILVSSCISCCPMISRYEITKKIDEPCHAKICQGSPVSVDMDSAGQVSKWTTPMASSSLLCRHARDFPAWRFWNLRKSHEMSARWRATVAVLRLAWQPMAPHLMANLGPRTAPRAKRTGFLLICAVFQVILNGDYWSLDGMRYLSFCVPSTIITHRECISMKVFFRLQRTYFAFMFHWQCR